MTIRLPLLLVRPICICVSGEVEIPLKIAGKERIGGLNSLKQVLASEPVHVWSVFIANPRTTHQRQPINTTLETTVESYSRSVIIDNKPFIVHTQVLIVLTRYRHLRIRKWITGESMLERSDRNRVQTRRLGVMAFEEKIRPLVVELQCLLSVSETEVIGGVVGGEDEINLMVAGLIIDGPIANGSSVIKERSRMWSTDRMNIW
jgi:hypothetical protein